MNNNSKPEVPQAPGSINQEQISPAEPLTPPVAPPAETLTMPPTPTAPEIPAAPPISTDQEINLSGTAPDTIAESTPEEIAETKKIIAVEPETMAGFNQFTDKIYSNTETN